MFNLETGCFSLAAVDSAVLNAYIRAEQALLSERPRQEMPEGEEIERVRWVTRIRELEGIPHDCIAPSHGRLIAMGYLQFQLQGRDAGVLYRVTAEGRAALDPSADPAMCESPLRRSA